MWYSHFWYQNWLQYVKRERIPSACITNTQRFLNYIEKEKKIYQSVQQSAFSQDIFPNNEHWRSHANTRDPSLDSSKHQNIQQLQPFESWGPSNQRSHDGFTGPIVLSNKNHGKPNEGKQLSRGKLYLDINPQFKSNQGIKECIIVTNVRYYSGIRGSGFVSTLPSNLKDEETVYESEKIQYPRTKRTS